MLIGNNLRPSPVPKVGKDYLEFENGLPDDEIAELLGVIPSLFYAFAATYSNAFPDLSGLFIHEHHATHMLQFAAVQIPSC